MSDTENIDLCIRYMEIRADKGSDPDIVLVIVRDARAELASLKAELAELRRLAVPVRLDEEEFANDPVIAWRAYHEMKARYDGVRKALVDLFQSCSRLPLEEMDRMENEINAASAALNEANDRHLSEKEEE